jgi:hypothetical protein
MVYENCGIVMREGGFFIYEYRITNGESNVSFFMGIKFKDLTVTIYGDKNSRSIAENFHEKGGKHTLF